jgi:peptidoglycan-associated lipoprotein
MNTKRIFGLLILLAISIAFLVGCAAQQETQQGPTPEQLAAQREQARQDSLAQAREQARQDSLARVAEAERQRLQAQRQVMQDELNAQNQAMNSLKVVHFDFDKSDLKAGAREALQNNAEALMEYTDWQVVIEGHCDERGSTEYNLALGERRANAVKEYYVNYGIDANRLELISYGEERPVAQGSNEQAWAKNRRAVTKVTGGMMTSDDVPTIEELRQQEQQEAAEQEQMMQAQPEMEEQEMMAPEEGENAPAEEEMMPAEEETAEPETGTEE